MKRPAWFGPRRLGFGIGPRNWQGWAVLALFVLVVTYVPRAWDFAGGQYWLLVAVATVVLLGVIYLTYRPDGDRE